MEETVELGSVLHSFPLPQSLTKRAHSEADPKASGGRAIGRA